MGPRIVPHDPAGFRQVQVLLGIVAVGQVIPKTAESHTAGGRPSPDD
jgi:hypothetical protein